MVRAAEELGAGVRMFSLQRRQRLHGRRQLHPHIRCPRPTRAAASVAFFHKHHFTLPPFAPALSREFAPYKPNPASLLRESGGQGVLQAPLQSHRDGVLAAVLQWRGCAAAPPCAVQTLRRSGASRRRSW